MITCDRSIAFTVLVVPDPGIAHTSPAIYWQSCLVLGGALASAVILLAWLIARSLLLQIWHAQSTAHRSNIALL